MGKHDRPKGSQAKAEPPRSHRSRTTHGNGHQNSGAGYGSTAGGLRGNPRNGDPFYTPPVQEYDPPSRGQGAPEDVPQAYHSSDSASTDSHSNYHTAPPQPQDDLDAVPSNMTNEMAQMTMGPTYPHQQQQPQDWNSTTPAASMTPIPGYAQHQQQQTWGATSTIPAASMTPDPTYSQQQQHGGGTYTMPAASMNPSTGYATGSQAYPSTSDYVPSVDPSAVLDAAPLDLASEVAHMTLAPRSPQQQQWVETSTIPAASMGSLSGYAAGSQGYSSTPYPYNSTVGPSMAVSMQGYASSTAPIQEQYSQGQGGDQGDEGDQYHPDDSVDGSYGVEEAGPSNPGGSLPDPSSLKVHINMKKKTTRVPRTRHLDAFFPVLCHTVAAKIHLDAVEKLKDFHVFTAEHGDYAYATERTRIYCAEEYEPDMLGGWHHVQFYIVHDLKKKFGYNMLIPFNYYWGSDETGSKGKKQVDDSRSSGSGMKKDDGKKKDDGRRKDDGRKKAR